MLKNIVSGFFQKKQTAFTLTAIQVTGATSLPAFNSSISLLHQCGFAKAFWILFAGNIFVWLLALAIVQMTANTTKNTLDNVRGYIGHGGSQLAGVILLISTCTYYVTQTNLTTQTLLAFFQVKMGYGIDEFFQFGVLLGIVSILAIMPGIKGLRWVATLSFPIIIVVFASLFFLIPTSDPITVNILPDFGALTIVLSSLAVVIDYPTFFQHSKSKKSSILAITSIQAISFFIGVGGLYLGRFVGEDFSGWNLAFNDMWLMKILFLLMVILSCVCVNAWNIYSASIAWELMAPNALLGKKEYTILGFGLTSIFVLTTGIVSMEAVLNLTDIPLANLCLVLGLGYLCTLRVGNFSEKEKFILFFGWLLGSGIALFATSQGEVHTTLMLLGFALSLSVVALTLIMKRAKVRS